MTAGDDRHRLSEARHGHRRHLHRSSTVRGGRGNSCWPAARDDNRARRPTTISAGTPLCASTGYSADGRRRYPRGVHSTGPQKVIGGRFEIERVAGSGGMGDVYLARDRQDGEPVALKLLRSTDAQLVARFQREARLLAELQHPAIARHVAHGVSEQGQHYLAMEWLEGEDLAARLARGPLGIDEGLALVHRVAEALALVHTRGVIHRDLKPANLFLQGGRLDEVKLLDFGVARDPAATAGITEPGVPLGTPAYMAPEQIRGELDVDARADVYALGCILFECLTGQPPFWADNVFAVFVKVLFEDASRPSALRPEVPEPIDRLTARLMAKDREGRPRDAAAAASALAARSPEDTTALSAPALTRRERGLTSVVLARVETSPLAATVALPRVDAVTRPALRVDAATDPALPADAATLDVRGKAAASTGPAPLPHLRRAAAEHGGRLEPLRDGGFAAILTGAETPTDLAARAVRCGLALRKLLPGARLAVATGWDSLDGGQPVGPVIDRASALLLGGGTEPPADDADVPEAQAPVLVDAITASLLGTEFEMASGAHAPAVVGEREPLDEARTLLGKPTPFVGRDRELRALEDLFDACASEPCARAGLVIAGAGMGKSRLRLELVRRLRARAEPPEIWIARADPARAGAPLDLLGQVVRSAARLVDGEPLERRREQLAARVARHVEPALRERVTEFLGEMVGAPFPDDARVQLRAARRDPMLMGDQIRRAWVDFIDAECRTGPVLVVLEDLHWGDVPTVQCIDAALRLLGERPLMVLALARPEVRATFPALWVDRGTMEIGLVELPRRACERMVRAALSDRPDEGHVAEIVRRAAGNPFFVEELVRAAVEGRDAREAPETVLAMVQARFKDLDAEERLLLRAGSVLGEVFWQGAAARLVGLGDERGAALVAQLAALERREWIVRRPEPRFVGEVEFAFRHGLVREAAYSMLTDVDRRLGHRLAGAWLEEAGERDALVLAEHFEQGEALAAAARYYERAAEQALEASDLEGALARVERAFACAPGEDAAGRLHALAATAHNWRGAFVDAERAAKSAVALAPAGSRAAYTALAMLAWASGALGKEEQLEAVASSLPQEASWLPQDPKGEALERELLLACCSTTGWLRELGRHTAAEALERVMDRVQPEQLEPGMAGHIYEMRSFAACDPPRRLELALRLTEAAIHAYERDGAWRNACLTRVNLGVIQGRLGAHGPAESTLHAAKRLAAELDLRFVANAACIYLVRTHLAQGQSAAARTLAAGVVEEARASANGIHMNQARVLLAQALIDLGELAHACAQATAVIEETQAYPALQAVAQATLAHALLRAGSAVEALAAARGAFELLQRTRGFGEDEAFVHLAWAEALHACGDGDAARTALATAHDQLRADAEAIESPALRRSFLEAVPEHARVLARAEAWGVGGG
ncbi:protein kinase [Sorangium sp. So ce315]|uniref:protein kinase domain-containing protein n=1 Tax=Sorangium sp. So ce315 TaxID=3133299 RepID=UPI003F619751